MGELKGVHQDRLKVRFLKPEGKISRRELLKLALPRFEVIPFVKPALCRGSQECGLCLDICPLEAIKVEADEVIIDTALCSGCGACIAACPERAIVHPAFSLEQLDKGMGELLPAGSPLLEPRIMAFVCQNCLPAPSKGRTGQLTYPSNVLSLEIPCLGMATPWLVLRAFDRGVRGLALVFNQKKCPVGVDAARWQEQIQFVQALLNVWGIEPERIRAFDITGDSHKFSLELDRFAQEMAGLGPTLLGVSGPTLFPGNGLLLPALIKGLSNKLGGAAKGPVTAGAVPFGKLKLDGAQCTGCCLCARDCPTPALTTSASEGADGYQLLFRHDRCVACGRCIEVCPEQCLYLERILELDKIDSPAVVLFEDVMARCRQCGDIIGSRAMINRLQVKLLAMGDSLTSQLELCPMCKARARFNLGKVTPGANH